jgi:hypothetical protein
MKKILFLALLLCSCNDSYKKVDGVVLTDMNTGKKYLVKHHIGATFMVYEQVKEISEKDTITSFKELER